MRIKTRLGIITVVLLLIGLAGLINWGCTGSTTVQKEVDPAKQKAVQDSLYNLHKTEVARLFSFGWEPFKQGDYQKAKRYFKQVTDIDTSGLRDAVVYRYLGRAYLQLNVSDSAEWAFKEDIRRNPDNCYSYKPLGYLYRVQGRTSDAIEVYTALIKFEPDSAGHYRYLGDMLVQNEEPEKAIEAYKMVNLLDPNDKNTQEKLDHLLSQSGDIEAMITQRESMVEQFPDDYKLRLELAESYHKIAEFEKAITHLKVVTEKESNNIHALELLGDSYHQTERFSNAVTIYEKILSIQPDDKKNICNLAMAHLFGGRYTVALREIRKALQIDPQYGLAFLTRGLVYEVAADKCISESGGKVSFDDKLVYKLANDEYEKARKDIDWKSDADRRLKGLETMIPTRGDYHMHKNQIKPNKPCYNWIN